MNHDQVGTQDQVECFLCALDPQHTCFLPQLEGRLIAVHERKLQGETYPVLILDTGTSRAEIYLERQYYKKFLAEIRYRGDMTLTHHLPVRIYHLPTAPHISEYQGRERRQYRANSYTLAVLAPDILLNITDLNQASYCIRQYLLHRLTSTTSSPATIRGNIVHHCFKELLKEHHHRQHQPEITAEQPSALATLQKHLKIALDLNQVELALANVSPETMQEEVLPHLESLANWYTSESNTLWDLPGSYVDEEESSTTTNQVRAETFLLAPEIGLRGRLDLFWQQSGRQRLLELKTGGSSGDLPKNDHRWQVHGYHALLTVRRNSHMKKALATLLYSGTPGKAQAFGIPATIREIQRVNETRNILVLNRVTAIPSAPPGYSRCSRCSMLEQCQTISSLLDWEQPVLDKPAEQAYREPSTLLTMPASTAQATHVSTERIRSIDETDRAFFQKYFHLLNKEDSAGILQQAQLWQQTIGERIERGSAIKGLKAEGTPTISNDGWQLFFRCHNTSELRDGDEILLSDGNPIAGEVVTGTITRITPESVTVWTRELIAEPQLIDRYDNELVHVRTLQNLLRWYYAPGHIRDLVAGRVHPRFIARDVPARKDFNVEQNLAVARALQMQDYLLIHGPPGTGKTSVIAEIVKRLTAQGERVMLAGFTNQAVDNMLKRLEKEGVTDYLRLGHERSVDATVQPHLLKHLADSAWTRIQNGQAPQGVVPTYAQVVQDVLLNTPIVASTTATWSSDRYGPAAGTQEATETVGLSFDVAIIDEAGQLTIPAILGALRFTKRFILVGDEKQLPPLVLHQEAIEEGLADSLFSFLKELDARYQESHQMALSACVALRIQYRMNKWISNFASRVFYDQLLQPHPSIAERRLRYSRQPDGQEPQSPAEVQALKGVLDPRLPLVFVDTRGEMMQSLDPKLSNVEAVAVRTIVGGLLTRGIAPGDIGIIAPFRAQVANIRRHLFTSDPQTGWLALPTDTALSVDTVDRFQGGERQVIIMSFATSNEPAPDSQRREFLINPHRLNVALTRAQCKLILVGCVPALENLPTFNRLLTYCRSMQTLLQLSPVPVEATAGSANPPHPA